MHTSDNGEVHDLHITDFGRTSLRYFQAMRTNPVFSDNDDSLETLAKHCAPSLSTFTNGHARWTQMYCSLPPTSQLRVDVQLEHGLANDFGRRTDVDFRFKHYLDNIRRDSHLKKDEGVKVGDVATYVAKSIDSMRKEMQKREARYHKKRAEGPNKDWPHEWSSFEIAAVDS